MGYMVLFINSSDLYLQKIFVGLKEGVCFMGIVLSKIKNVYVPCLYIYWKFAILFDVTLDIFCLDHISFPETNVLIGQSCPGH